MRKEFLGTPRSTFDRTVEVGYRQWACSKATAQMPAWRRWACATSELESTSRRATVQIQVRAAPAALLQLARMNKATGNSATLRPAMQPHPGWGGVKHSAPATGQGRPARKPCRPLIGAVAAQQGSLAKSLGCCNPGPRRVCAWAKWCLKKICWAWVPCPGPSHQSGWHSPALSGHVHPVVVGEQAQVHKRVESAECHSRGSSQPTAERAHHAHGQHFARPVFADLFQCRLHACEGIAQREQQRQPRPSMQAPGIAEKAACR